MATHVELLGTLAQTLAWALACYAGCVAAHDAVDAALARGAGLGKQLAALEALPSKATSNKRREAVRFLLVGAHHLVATALVVAGAVLRRPALVKHGVLAEVGFEVQDVAMMLTRSGPYQAASPAFVASMRAHHATGLLTGVPLVHLGLHANPHVRGVAGALLLSGTVSTLLTTLVLLLGDVYPRTMLALRSAEVAVFVVARGAVTPAHFVGLVGDLLREWKHGYATLALVALALVAGGFMARFSLGWLRVKAGALAADVLDAVAPPARAAAVGERGRLLARQSSSVHWINAGVDDDVREAAGVVSAAHAQARGPHDGDAPHAPHAPRGRARATRA